MLDTHSIEEEATRYVLGELSPKEQRRFEAQLARSETLRAQVRQLEEGALALALACPRRQAPREVWTGIKRALDRETRTESLFALFRLRFWRNGWAVATACLVGWAATVWYLHRAGQTGSPTAPAVAASQPAPASWPNEALANRPVGPAQPAVGLDHTTAQVLKTRAEEIGALRWQVASLSNRMAQLSEVLTQQQTQLAGPGHFKFFQLTSTGGAGGPAAPISPNVQRALVLAMARELGWLGPGAQGQANATGDGNQGSANPWDANWLAAYATGVDFVDLRFGTNRTERSQPPATEAAPLNATELAAQPSTAGGTVAGFISGTNAVLAFDPAAVPSGTPLTFWTTSASGQSHPVGEATVGDNPTVVTVGLSTGGSTTLTVFTAGGGGFSTIVLSPSGTPVP